MRVLWALNDGAVADFSTLNKHETENRGARSIQLMNAQNGDNMQKLDKVGIFGRKLNKSAGHKH